jgi:serine/threonine-protein kinase
LTEGSVVAQVELVEFLETRLRGFDGTGVAKLENIGWAAASWLVQEGSAPGAPISAKLVRILRPTATRVIDRAVKGVVFLEALRESIRYDDDLLAFLRFVEDWTNSTSTEVIKIPTPPVSLEPGDTIGGFEIVEPIAKGGMGLVYKAVQRSLDRTVALKVLNKELAQNGSFIERFHVEARAAAKLRHPNIVQVIEAGMCEKTGVQFIAFEFVEGRTASEHLRQKGKLPEDEALGIILGIARALSCAEEAGIVHRDIKPGNILLGADWVPKLGDLGLAKHIDEATRRTAVGLVIGTPHYMAPEQALSIDKLDVRVDLYALGITLFELVTGELPFRSRTAMGVIALHVNSDVPDPREFEPRVSEEVALLISHLSARARLKRYPSALEAVDNIQRALDGELPRPPGWKGEALAPTSESAAAGGEIVAEEQASPPAEAPPVTAAAPGPTAEQLLSSGRGFYSDALLVDRLELERDSRIRKSDDSPTMVLSEDMMRAFQLGKKLGRGPDGRIYDALVVGDQEFKGFRSPVTRATVRFGRDHDVLAREQELYGRPDRRIVQLLDSGVFNKFTYLALEKLELHPYERFGGKAVDPGVALDTFVNLLMSAKGLHVRRNNPLVLCDIKPDTIQIRAWSEEGLDDDAYRERIAAGTYQPVFADVSGTQKRAALRKGAGRPAEVVGSPIYLSPESMPTLDGEALVPGIYSARTDVFALSLILYVHLTGDKPYAHSGVYEHTGQEFLGELMALKASGADPVDWGRLHEVVGKGADRLEEILRPGLDPDPEKRGTANALLEISKKRFAVELKPAPASPYAFDAVDHGIRMRQGFFT